MTTTNETQDLGIPTLKNVVSHLWEKSEESLNRDELDFIANLDFTSECFYQNIADNLTEMALNIDGNENLGAITDKGLCTVLYNIAYQLESCNAMNFLGQMAEKKLRELAQKQTEQAKPSKNDSEIEFVEEFGDYKLFFVVESATYRLLALDSEVIAEFKAGSHQAAITMCGAFLRSEVA